MKTPWDIVMHEKDMMIQTPETVFRHTNKNTKDPPTNVDFE